MRIAALAVLLTAGCLIFPQGAHAKRLQAIASFSVLADVVQEIGGDRVEVKSLVPPDGDPHRFEPSPGDVRALKDADLIFVSGLGLEHWFASLIKASGYQGQPVVVSAGIILLPRRSAGEISDDPHVWNSVQSVKVWARNIANALIAADAAGAPDYERNAKRYAEALDEIDRYAHERLDEIPADKRKILTSHNAFEYFSRDYHVAFLSPSRLSTETESSAAKIASLIEQIRREKITAYFLQNSNDAKLIEQIALATGARPGGKLYSESLSPPAGPAPTFLKMFRYNVDHMIAAMRDPAP